MNNSAEFQRAASRILFGDDDPNEVVGELLNDLPEGVSYGDIDELLTLKPKSIELTETFGQCAESTLDTRTIVFCGRRYGDHHAHWCRQCRCRHLIRACAVYLYRRRD